MCGVWDLYIGYNKNVSISYHARGGGPKAKGKSLLGTAAVGTYLREKCVWYIPLVCVRRDCRRAKPVARLVFTSRLGPRIYPTILWKNIPSGGGEPLKGYRKVPIFRTPFWLCDAFSLSTKFLRILFTSHKTCMKVSPRELNRKKLRFRSLRPFF